MKSWSSLLIFVGAVVASPLSYAAAGAQEPLAPVHTHSSFDGWDLAEPRLLQFENSDEPIWSTEMEKIQFKAHGVSFFDVTADASLFAANLKPAKFTGKPPSFPSPSHGDQVKNVMETLSIEGPMQNLQKFTSFRTRHYKSETGRESQQWLLQKLIETTNQYAPKALQDVITVTEFPHSWGQNSIIVRINGTAAQDDAVVVIGAHQDSTNMWPFLPAPGADDDGSGTMSILEAYRALVSAGFTPSHAVEFHWYSAEEGGLLGSQAVAQHYADRDVNVISMSQFDMTAWVKRGTREEVGIIVDFVDREVTDFNKELVKNYLSIPYVETKCGYACSDHASWSKAGYRSSFTIESSFENSNKNIHSTNDRIDISDEFSFTHMLEFSKLAVAIAIELGGWEEQK